MELTGCFGLGFVDLGTKVVSFSFHPLPGFRQLSQLSTLSF